MLNPNLNHYIKLACLALPFLLWLPNVAAAQPGISAVTVTTGPQGVQDYTVSIQIVALMTLITLLPSMLLSMTAFTRIMIVLSLLRQALGTGQTPSNQILLGLSLFLTIFIMAPVFDKVNTDALQPYLAEKMDAATALATASEPFRLFMLKQTREADLEMFLRVSGKAELHTPDDVPFSLLLPAYVTSELKTAFQIGFLIFLPFLIIDLVVSSVLMSMGMMMLSPMVVSLPFKLMLFVLADGWSLILEMLAASFYVM
ncbi:flagellar biosynthesis protein flip [Methylocucumis oryzae]|uniref:Flagellar biosynthetic protein FliP n=1 Tax=Methylocucumis oryzae TaxID=1632867 RepID=A0A0F3IMA1_9GAMM|nr:flagellar type III secretion system pore protein FliP [Methylocucumis oryzae]KJV07885.1 flagellar biosynthesis protein flip [Methylocucumis oryzae]